MRAANDAVLQARGKDMKVFGKKIDIVPVLMLVYIAVCAVLNFFALFDPKLVNFILTIIYIAAWIGYGIYARRSLWLNMLPLIFSAMLIISSGTVYMSLDAENQVSQFVMYAVSPILIPSLVPLLGFGFLHIDLYFREFIAALFIISFLWLLYNISIIRRNRK